MATVTGNSDVGPRTGILNKENGRWIDPPPVFNWALVRCAYLQSAQKRWMRRQASSSLSFEVA